MPTDYNYQTSDSKNSTILMNIVRAAYSQPLQFTDVTTVAGQAALQASVGSSLPIAADSAAGSRIFGITPGLQASTNTTVNVANLNTQEFYRGLQTPISMTQIASYVSGVFNGVSPYVLLPLFVSDIEIFDSDGTKYTLHNRGDDPNAFKAFYTAAGNLIKAGLTVEQTKEQPTKVGPELFEADAKDPKVLAALIAAGNSASGTGDSGGADKLTLKKLSKTVAGRPVFQFEKGGGTSYRFCFGRGRSLFKYADFWAREPPRGDGLTVEWARADKTRFTVKLGKEYRCGAKITAGSDSTHDKATTELKFKTRSLEEIFYFLGEMVRTELLAANNEPDLLAIPPLDIPGAAGQFHLFHMERRLPKSGEPWVAYNGNIYCITLDPFGQNDASSRVVQLLTDLLALQSSAKNLPAPNLIAITP
jgi:hypothetical protein